MYTFLHYFSVALMLLACLSSATGAEIAPASNGAATTHAAPFPAALAMQETSPPASNMIMLEKDFFALLRELETHLPLTPKDIAATGIPLKPVTFSPTTTYYRTHPVQLANGVSINPVELRVVHEGPKKGSLFILYVNNATIPRAELEKTLGPLQPNSVPTGNSVHELYGFIKRIGKHTIFAGFRQQEPYSLKIITVKSVLE